MEPRSRLIPYTYALGLLMIAGVYVFIVCFALKDYIAWRSPGFLLGIAALPLVMMYNPERKKSLRFYYVALACCVLAWIVPAKTLLYLSLTMALCFLADSVLGKINFLPLLALLLMAPVCDYITQIFTFPIRLQLTAWAAQILSLTNTTITVAGNTIFRNGAEFTVDAACMGLNMMITSMLCGLMLLGFYQKRYGVTLSFFKVTLLMTFIALLNILSNLFRIILLVQFSILPAHVMHEAAGIICLVIYVIAPLCWLIPLLVKRFGKNKEAVAGEEPHSFMIVQSHVCLAACMFLVAYKNMKPEDATAKAAYAPVAGYNITALDGGILKMESAATLIYIKSIPGFYFTDHHPAICWKGSGYGFHQVKEEKLNGKTIYTALLEKGQERLYTAWWYDNGHVQTISQAEWRWDNLRGGNKYAIINVSAADEQTLKKEVSRWLRDDENLLQSLHAVPG